MSRTILINQIQELLDPRPKYITFRHTEFDDRTKVSDPAGMFHHNGKMLSRKQCLEIPAQRRIFIMRKVKT